MTLEELRSLFRQYSLINYFILLFCAELTDFLRQLDTRADAAIKDSKKHSAERKERVVSDPLDSTPPQGAPAWTINKDWLKGITMHLILASIYAS